MEQEIYDLYKIGVPISVIGRRYAITYYRIKKIINKIENLNTVVTTNEYFSNLET